MKIHEYQAKQILNKFGVQIPQGEVAFTPAEAKEIAEKIGPRVVLKAQIHAEEAKEEASKSPTLLKKQKR
jgi:succinyl-CoA synthetase beta subunit